MVRAPTTVPKGHLRTKALINLHLLLGITTKGHHQIKVTTNRLLHTIRGHPTARVTQHHRPGVTIKDRLQAKVTTRQAVRISNNLTNTGIRVLPHLRSMNRPPSHPLKVKNFRIETVA